MNFMRTFFFLLLATVSLYAEKPKVLVSVAPYVPICKDLSDDLITTELLVPTGFSSHTYEPTPKQIFSCLDASLWFTIGELFEVKIKKVLQNENPHLAVIDLRQGLSLLKESCHHACHSHESADPHIWMSPKMMLTQVITMAKALETAFPTFKEAIEQNLAKTTKKLETLDKEIRLILANKQGHKIFVSHPAYGYFCREYGLKQVAIEFEGKDPTPRDLTTLIKQAKQAHVQMIFTQPQYSTKAAEIIANETDARVVSLNPYSENYYESMKEIAENFAKGAVA